MGGILYIIVFNIIYIMTHHKDKSVLNQLPAKQMFALGIIGGFLIFCTLGFFYLLFTGSDGLSEKGSSPSRNTAAAPGNPTAAPTPQPSGKVTPIDDDRDHIRGDKKAKLSLVEYSDFECPFCGRFHTTMNQVLEAYDGDVNWVYRHLPLTQLHAGAQDKSLASECAGEQGKFWEFADALFEDQNLPVSELSNLAEEVGVRDIKDFESCIEGKVYGAKVGQDAADAAGNGTPHTLVVDEDGNVVGTIRGAQPFESVQQTLDALL